LVWSESEACQEINDSYILDNVEKISLFSIFGNSIFLSFLVFGKLFHPFSINTALSTSAQKANELIQIDASSTEFSEPSLALQSISLLLTVIELSL